MKKTIFIILLVLLIESNLSFANDLDLHGEAAILMDPDTGQVLFEKNSHMKLHPASTTKIMTGILAIELGNADDIVTIDEEVVYKTDGSHIALEPGEKIYFSDLLNALLIESANDAGLAIAKHISGTVEDFAKLMNKKALEIGAVNTNFKNPHGLTEDEHLTTAYDLSLIAKYAMENPEFREIVKNHATEMPKTNKKDEKRYFNSRNRLLYSDLQINVDGEIVPAKYEGVTGIKTGYTSQAKNCLVASATRGKQSFITVVLKSEGKELFSDTHKLLNYGFKDHEKTILAFKEQFIDNISIENGKVNSVPGILEEDLSTCLPIDSTNDIERKVILEENLIAPIKEGDKLGFVEYYSQNQLLGEVDIISTLDVEELPDLKSSGIIGIIKNKWYIFLAGFLVIIRVLILFRKNSKRKRFKRNRRSMYKY